MSLLDDYLKDEDPNKFWRMSSGEHENLLDLALQESDELKELLELIKKDLIMRAEFDTEDGGAIVNLSSFIYDRLNEAIK